MATAASVTSYDGGSIEVIIDPAAVSQMLSDPSHMTGRFLFSLGNRILSHARALTPVDTGRLRSSLSMAVEGHPPDECWLNIGTDVEYARYVHDGTRYMAARPFLATAVRAELGSL